ncbi:class I SAM-dependent methyltransferase [Solicola gregarius]|uniref:Class I SAM-dependent methyltransferase n=1 Tax=Solicola gregarius TaxID=2908642 RepID=A0AA46YJT5_9ACTN|nr:class I SAM-dependent methyltransferase [Solicola gregarius]UYM04692.1 class I SAM-dependent methyltransferase [Solicola gregarius]
MTQTEYILGSDNTLGRRQLAYLEVLYDQPTRRVLADVEIGPGSRCLDVGSGAGSTARWLAEHVGPTGRVTAVDIAPDHLVGVGNLVVRQHDINDGVPEGGPFDLIHARLVLMHLSRRVELLSMLVDGLAPGGWIVIGEAQEYGTHPDEVVSAPNVADVAVFNRVVDTTINVVGRGGGIDYEWVNGLGGRLVDAGLVDVRGLKHRALTSGGMAGGMLNANYVRQVQPLVLDAGVTEADLARFYELSLDPAFVSWAMPLTYFSGRKPGP